MRRLLVILVLITACLSFNSNSGEILYLNVEGYSDIQINYKYTGSQPGQILLVDVNNQTKRQLELRNSGWQKFNIDFYLQECKYVLIVGELDQLYIHPGYLYTFDQVFQRGSTFFSYINSRLTTVLPEQLGSYLNQQSRPQYHFSQIQNWINDPNGLVYYNGTYHMFQQFNPYSTVWGPMHWGHAVSSNLVNWKFLPIALYPEDLVSIYQSGGAFSGSAIVRDGKMSLIYTNAFTSPQKSFQTQNMTVSPNYILFNYGQYPIIQSPPEQVVPSQFRDPFVFYLEDLAKYFLLVGSEYEEQGSILIYSSNDLQSWDYLGVFFQDSAYKMIECPNFFLSNTGKWVLLISVENGHKTYYQVGDFDEQNYRFVNYGIKRLVDFGRDYYAPQIFQGLTETIVIGWMQNWDSPRDTYGNQNFSGAMTLPRKFTLDPATNLLLQTISPNVLQALRKQQKPLFQNIDSMTTGKFTYESVPELSQIIIQIDSQFLTTGDLQFDFIPYQVSNGPSVTLVYHYINKTISIQQNDKSSVFHSSTLSSISQGLNLNIFADRSALEIFINSGEQVASFRYPSPPVPSTQPNLIIGSIILIGTLKSAYYTITVYELQGIW